MIKTEHKYLVAGVIFGLLFPVFSWGVKLWSPGVPVSIDTVHQFVADHNAAHLFIDFAPLTMALVFYLIGRRQTKIENAQLSSERAARQKAIELDQTQQRMADFIKSTALWFWETDDEHRFIDFRGGPAEEPVSEQLLKRVLGKRSWEMPNISASDEAMERYRAMVTAQEPIRDFRAILRTENGSIRYLSVTGDPAYDRSGKFLGYRGSTSDITEQVEAAAAIEESERKYRLMFMHAADSMFLVNPDGLIIIDANLVAAERLGYTMDELIGMSMNEINIERNGTPSPAVAAMLQERNRRLREEGALAFETNHVRKDGSLMPVEVNCHYMEMDGMTVVEAVARDITERKKVDKMKGDFISTVSHELRTPLTSIVGSLGLARSGKFGGLDGQLEQIIEIAYNNSQRLVRLINDILDIEKIESGKMDLDKKPIELDDLVAKSIEENMAFATQFGVTLQKKGDQSEHACVMGDWDRLLQVMANLLSNAAKFSPAGGVVDVNVMPNGKTVRVVVSDKGPGVKRDFRDKIFEKFTQSDMTDSKEKGGTGLGLNISKAIVEMHGGVIGFDNNPDCGASFYFELPRQELENVEAA